MNCILTKTTDKKAVFNKEVRKKKSVAEKGKKQYGITIIWQTDKIHEQCYAISVERKVAQPTVKVITETAR